MNKTVKKEVESSCEYILPDYMGDIKKILYSRARCMPGGKYVSGSDAEHNGVVEYEILYADSDNRLSAVNASSDYSVSVSNQDDALSDSYHMPRISSLAVRTTGPRKFNLKSNVTSRVVMTSDKEAVESVFEGVDADSVQKNTTSIKSEVYGLVGSTEYEIAEEWEHISGAQKDGVEIVFTSGEVRITDIHATDRGAAVKGELIVEVIKRVEDTPPYSSKRSFSFETSVELGELPAEAKLFAKGVPSSLAVMTAEDGEDTVLSLNAIIEINVFSAYNEELTVITDAYSLDTETENTYSELEYTTLEDVENAEFHIDERIENATLGIGSVRDILITGADVVCTTLVPQNRTAKIGGEITVSGVACEINEENGISYVPFKHTFEFAHNVNINCQTTEKCILECDACACVADASIDGTSLYFKVTVNACVFASCKEKIAYLTNCRACEGTFLRPSRSRITVYYPDKEEKLFEIAKKHHTTTEKLCIDNSLTAETALGTDIRLPKKLIIK